MRPRQEHLKNGASLLPLMLVIALPVASKAQLEEITVTAQRREQGLQEVPLAVTAFNQEQLDRVGASDISRIDLVTPGLEFGQFGLGARPTIRGQGVANFEANTDTPVGFFVDGVYLGRSQQVFTVLNDVERVEVNRGPQGTLFGRNTTGGSINIITQKPVQSFQVGGQVRVGNYDRFNADAYINLPVNDELATRLSVSRVSHDGFLQNTSPDGNDYNDQDLTYVRGSARWTPNEQLTIDLAVDYWEQGGAGASFSGVKFFDQVTPDVNTWAQSLSGQFVPGNTTEDWVFAADSNSARENDSVSIVTQIAYEREYIGFKSITGFADFSGFGGGDSDFSTLPLAVLSLDTDSQTITQEFQAYSVNQQPEWLEWIVGLYFLNEDVDETFQFDFVPAPIFFSNRIGNATTTSYAIYGQTTLEVTDQLNITVGGRYTVDEKGYEQVDLARVDDRGIIDGDETFEEFTWRAGLEYFFRPDVMGYFHASTGFKSGGFNRYREPEQGLQYEQVFEPETLINYEGGVKADWLDGRARTNLAIFYNKIDNLQAYGFDDSVPTSVTTNAGEASTFGVELEATFLPTDASQVQAIVAYLDAEYDDYPTFSNGAVNIDASGNRRENAPRWTATFIAQHDFSLGEYGTLTPYAQFSYKSNYFVTAANDPNGLDEQEGFTQTDLKLFWQSPDSRWTGELFVQNLEDEFPLIGGFLATNGYWLTYGPEPRTWGARLSYDF